MADRCPDTTVSVIVPTFNRLDRLKRVLAALGSQTVDPEALEVVVVSDGSSDGTDEFMRAADFPFKLKFRAQPNAGPAAARNLGVKLASGGILLFVDDDVVAASDLVEQHLRTHRDAGRRAVVIGPMLTPPDHHPSRYVRWEQAMLYKQYDALARGVYAPTSRQFYTGNASLRRDFLIAAGGFDERFRRAEDVELAYRLERDGACFYFNPAAVGWHYAERSRSSWLQIALDYGRNEVRSAAELGPGRRPADLRAEFQGRNAVLRAVARVCVGRRRVESASNRFVLAVAAAADRLHAERAVRAALSIAYCTTYYSGLAEELGGAPRLWRLISTGELPEPAV